MTLLDYQTPRPPPRTYATDAVLRFGGGIAAGIAVTLIIGIVRHDDLGNLDCLTCGLAGLLVLICCGLLRLGLFIRERAQRWPMCERHALLTVAVGSAYVGLYLCILSLLDDVAGNVEGVVPYLIVSYLIGVPLLCAWVVFRRADALS